MKRFIPVLLLIGLGAAAGWFAHDASHDHAHEDDHAGHDHGEGDAKKPALSDQALANLGIKLKAAELSTFTRTLPVPGRVVPRPVTYQPVVAPLGGTVQSVQAQFGALAQPGEVLVTLVRDAIPRASLTLTEDILKPVSEDFHGTVGELRKAVKGMEIIQAEIERIEAFTSAGTEDGLPVLPRKNIIDLRYEKARIEQEIANLRSELARHGLNAGEITNIEAGEIAQINPQFWQNALRRNGLWPALAERIHAQLPESIRDLPWTAATIGELIAGGYVDDGFLTWLADNKNAGDRFLEIGGLLQEGHSLDKIRTLHALGALDPIVLVRAPLGAESWDVHQVAARPGTHVDMGQELLTLANPDTLFLRVDPVGSESAAVTTAFARKLPIRARPLVAGAGPDLDDLHVMTILNDPNSEGTVAYVEVKNRALDITERADGVRFRSWALRDGLKYVLSVPVDEMSNVFVLPSEAVVDEGAEKVVFVFDGDDYEAVKVVVRYQDHEFAVLGADSELKESGLVVTRGAFGLSLALRAEQGGPVDAHHGHSH